MPTGTAIYQGTSGDDLFTVDTATLATAKVLAGAGDDTLQIIMAGSYSFSSAAYGTIAGIDVFDFSSHADGMLEIRLTSGVMNQSDAAQLTIVSGASGIDLLRVGSSVGGNVFVAGIGEVRLDNGTDNIVNIADGASVHVVGGAGSDTIRASATGSVLDGGAGNDLLFAAAGTDTIKFGVGDRADIVRNFDVAHDVVVVEGITLTLMSEVAGRLSTTAAGARLDLGNGDSLTFAGIAVADLTAANFAGVTEGTAVIVVQPGTTAATLNTLLDNAGPDATIVLAAGHHIFDREIVIRHDRVNFVGAGEGGTFVTFDYPVGTGGNGISVRGGAETTVGTLAVAATRGATSITLTSVTGLQAGDALHLSLANDPDYLSAHGWETADADLLASHPFREIIVAITSIDGTTVHLASPLAFDFAAGATTVAEMDLVSGVRIAEMTIGFSLGTPNANDFINTHPAFLGSAAVLVEGTRDIVVEHLSILNAASHGLDVASSLNARIDDIFIDGAHNKGPDGNGYGLQIYETFDSTFTQLEIFDVRHAVLLSAWDAEIGNFVHVTDTNRDINFHGSEDHSNTVIVDRSVLAYDPAQHTGIDDGFWPLVSDGGASHTLTDIYGGNTVRFAYARGFDAPDEIYATDGGAYINGCGARDILVGGAGNDIIVGGTSKDRMSGGNGSDSFLFRLGDNRDFITDFDPATGGDHIVISGIATVDSFTDVSIVARGNDVLIRYAANATITLEGCLVSEIGAHCFVFDPTGANYGALF